MSQRDNISSEEVEKFNDLAREWWNPHGSFAPLHKLNPLRFEYIRENSSLDGKTAIDVGCGGGILTESLASVAANVHGIDMAEKGLAVANIHKNKSKLTNIKYSQSTVEDYALKSNEKFDVLTCMEMLEHVPSPGETIQACSDIVIDGGDLFFATINRNIKSYIMAIVGAEYILNLLPKGTHEFDCFIKPSELEKWSKSAGLELIELIGVVYNPITTVFSLSDDVDVNYMMHCKKINDGR